MEGVRLVHISGCASAHRGVRAPQPIISPNGTIYAHLAGRPLSNGYMKAIERVNREMASALDEMNVRTSQKKGRRGTFLAVNVGISSGSGNSVRI